MGTRQKPWNKVPRTEKFWVGSRQLSATFVNTPILLTGMAPQYIEYYQPDALNAAWPDQPASPGLRALQNGKIHRFQGDIWCWLDPNTELGETVQNSGGGVLPPSNIQFLTYAWMKMDVVADFNTLQGAYPATSFSTQPRHDLRNMLLRDDIIRWGTIPVFGIAPRMRMNLTDDDSAVLGYGYAQNHVARIPFPRIPKAGYTMKQGEALVCIAAAWGGPSEGGDPTFQNRDIVVYDASRLLCSV